MTVTWPGICSFNVKLHCFHHTFKSSTCWILSRHGGCIRTWFAISAAFYSDATLIALSFINVLSKPSGTLRGAEQHGKDLASSAFSVCRVCDAKTPCITLKLQHGTWPYMYSLSQCHYPIRYCRHSVHSVQGIDGNGGAKRVFGGDHRQKLESEHRGYDTEDR